MTPFQRIPRLYVQQWGPDDHCPIFEIAQSRMDGDWPISLSWGDLSVWSQAWTMNLPATLRAVSFSFSKGLDMSAFQERDMFPTEDQ